MIKELKNKKRLTKKEKEVLTSYQKVALGNQLSLIISLIFIIGGLLVFFTGWYNGNAVISTVNDGVINYYNESINLYDFDIEIDDDDNHKMVELHLDDDGNVTDIIMYTVIRKIYFIKLSALLVAIFGPMIMFILNYLCSHLYYGRAWYDYKRSI